MAADQDKINQVFSEWGNVYFSQGEKDGIRTEHGEEVLTAVLAVYRTLMDAGMGPQGMDESLRLFAVAARQYPWLSDNARGKLLHAFVMNWK